MRKYSDSTLMGMTKSELIAQLRCAEYNRTVAEETLAQQAENLKDWEPVVRCKDCKHHEDEEPGMVYCPNLVGGWVGENWFCADGERGYEEAGGRKVKVIYSLGESDEWWHEKLCQLKEGHIQLTENDQEIIRAVKAEAKREGIRRALIKKGLLPDKEM